MNSNVSVCLSLSFSQDIETVIERGSSFGVFESSKWIKIKTNSKSIVTHTLTVMDFHHKRLPLA